MNWAEKTGEIPSIYMQSAPLKQAYTKYVFYFAVNEYFIILMQHLE